MISTVAVHPMLVHFPIALVLFGFIAEASSLIFKKEACLSKTGLYLLISGTGTALLALLTGTFFASDMQGAEKTHELFAWITLITLLFALAIRLYLIVQNIENTKYKWVAFALYALASIAVSITGFFGGALVYG